MIIHVKTDCLFCLLVLLSLELGACKQVNEKNPGVIENSAISSITNKSRDGILVCAHRSYHKQAPENSLASIRMAIKAGIDLVELDIRTTKDSMLVLMHDDTIGRTTTGTGKIKDLTYEELKQFNLKLGDSVTDAKVPLVTDALTLLKKSDCIANLDLKAVNFQQLHKMLTDMEMQHRVISFIGKKKKVMEMIGIDTLYATLPLSKTKEDIIFYAENTPSTLQHFTDKSFTTELMQLAKENNQLIFINTLWDEDDELVLGNTGPMDKVIALGPAIIQTDHPKLLVDYLRSKNLHK